ncbi:MAG: hypothetical protein Q9171_004613 [Xanthocarpia ochracea]
MTIAQPLPVRNNIEANLSQDPSPAVMGKETYHVNVSEIPQLTAAMINGSIDLNPSKTSGLTAALVKETNGVSLSQTSELATSIAANIGVVNEYLHKNNLPFPSFHEDGPVNLMLSPEAENAKTTAIEACLRLRDLLCGPVELLRPTINAVSLEAIYRYDIANKVPLGGEISFDELSLLCDMYEPDLRRILRFAIVHHRVFCEHRKGWISHSAASRTLAEDSLQQDALGLHFDDGWQSSAKVLPPYSRGNDEVQGPGADTDGASQSNRNNPSEGGQLTTEKGFCLAHDTDKPAFGYFEDNPAKAKRFAGAMTSFASYQGHDAEFLVNGYPWASLGHAVVVDVGGSEGAHSAALARAFPKLEFIVQDLPAVVEAVQNKPRAVELADRIKFMPHDMFTEQPVAADVYLFRWIFHDWPDKYVIRILQQLIPVMKNGARVLINEIIMPEPNTLPLLRERRLRTLDVDMLTWFNSREREKDDWIRIWQSVDKRFRFVDAWTPKGAALGIIEAVWES